MPQIKRYLKLPSIEHLEASDQIRQCEIRHSRNSPQLAASTPHEVKDVSAMSSNIGKVKFFDDSKGWGILVNASEQEVFVHYRSIQKDGYKTLKTGQTVEFEQVTTERGLAANEVVVISS